MHDRRVEIGHVLVAYIAAREPQPQADHLWVPILVALDAGVHWPAWVLVAPHLVMLDKREAVLHPPRLRLVIDRPKLTEAAPQEDEAAVRAMGKVNELDRTYTEWELALLRVVDTARS